MLNILHLEDHNDDAQLIREALSHESVPCHLTRVETREAFLEAMDHGDWDIILADYSLPSFNGVSALRVALAKRPQLPFIFVTGSLGEELAVETLRNGATDFILKHRLDRLPQAVARAMRESESAQAQREAERQIKADLREKELLLREVHQRVNTNLRIICSLLSMQSGAIDDPLLASALRESQKRVQSMAMIHAICHASGSLTDIDFGGYARLLASEVSGGWNVDTARIGLVFELAPIRLGIDQAVPCGLILNEMLSIAISHAFPGNSGEVRVSLHQQEGCILLAVAGGGVGPPEEIAGNETKSLGLTIINVLTRQLGGNLEITRGREAGFVLTFTQLAGN